MKRRESGFTLVEIALAIGIVAGALSVLIALLPVGIGNYGASRRALTASHLLKIVANDVMTAAANQPSTSLFALGLPPENSAAQTFELTENAIKSDSHAAENYHVNLEWIAAEPHDYKARQAHIEITWPAAADSLTARSRGQFIETIIAVNRNP